MGEKMKKAGGKKWGENYRATQSQCGWECPIYIGKYIS